MWWAHSAFVFRHVPTNVASRINHCNVTLPVCMWVLQKVKERALEKSSCCLRAHHKTGVLCAHHKTVRITRQVCYVRITRQVCYVRITRQMCYVRITRQCASQDRCSVRITRQVCYPLITRQVCYRQVCASQGRCAHHKTGVLSTLCLR